MRTSTRTLALAMALLAPLAVAAAARAQISFHFENDRPEQATGKIVAHIAVGTVIEAPQGGMPLFGGPIAQPLKDLVERLRQARGDMSVGPSSSTSTARRSASASSPRFAGRCGSSRRPTRMST